MSNADEILKFKQLYDAGAISADEFEAQKTRILAQPDSPSTQPASAFQMQKQVEPHKARYSAMEDDWAAIESEHTMLSPNGAQAPVPPMQNTGAPASMNYQASPLNAGPAPTYQQAPQSQQGMPQASFQQGMPQAGFQQAPIQQPNLDIPNMTAPATSSQSSFSNVTDNDPDSDEEGYTNEELYGGEEQAAAHQKRKEEKEAKHNASKAKKAAKKNSKTAAKKNRKNAKSSAADMATEATDEFTEVDAEDQEYEKTARKGDIFGILAILAGLLGFYLHVIPCAIGIVLGIIGLFRDRTKWVSLFGIMVSTVVMLYPILNPTPIVTTPPAGETAVTTQATDENGNPITVEGQTDATTAGQDAQVTAGDQTTQATANAQSNATNQAVANPTGEGTVNGTAATGAEAAKATAKTPEEIAKAQENAATYVDAMETILKQQYGDQYTIVGDETGCLISFWKDGLGDAADQARAGDAATEQTWKELKSSIQGLSQTAYDQYCSSVSEDGHVMLNLVDDRNHDKILLMFEDGKCHMDVVGTN